MEKLNFNKIIRRSFAVLFWVMLWQVVSNVVGKDLLIASPYSVVKSIIKLCGEGSFWNSLWFTFIRISLGFILAMVLGVFMAVVSGKSILIKEALSIPMSIIKSVPVASFIIIALIWISSKNLSIFISFLMVLPIFYTNTLKGIECVDKQLIQMSEVFKIGVIKKIRYIYIPEIMPYFISSATVSLGLCWKAGIAAEVIGIPTGSIGEKLYQSKIFLNTSELFAWTVVIIIISVIFEKAFMLMLRKMEEKIYC